MECGVKMAKKKEEKEEKEKKIRKQMRVLIKNDIDILKKLGGLLKPEEKISEQRGIIKAMQTMIENIMDQIDGYYEYCTLRKVLTDELIVTMEDGFPVWEFDTTPKQKKKKDQPGAYS